MANVFSYLEHLSFDPKLGKTAVAKYFANPRLVFLVVMMIVLVGTTSFLGLPRTLNPEISIPIVIVSAALPGASPADVESLLSKPIEDAVSGVTDIKTVSSVSRDSFSTVTVEFNSGVDPEKARADVKAAVDSVNDLPTDASTPKVKKLDFENQPIWTFSLTGDASSLERFAKTLQDDLEGLSSVDRVSVSGLEEQEVQILINPNAIADYHIQPLAIAQIIKTSLKSFPAGITKTDASTFVLTIDPAISSVEDIRTTQITIDSDTTVPLSHIATISERSKPDQLHSYFIENGHPIDRSLTFYVYRKKTSNIEAAAFEAKKKVDDVVAKYEGAFHVHTLTDAADSITEQFTNLERDFTITILLVSLLLLIFLGIRQAFVAAFAIPLTFLITFIIMAISGIALSFISLFSLLLSLGLLVDDAIVVISAMTSYYRSGKFTPYETALLVWHDFLIPVLTTTITTVWAFVPLLLASGIIGEFIKPIPVVVSTTLLASSFVAMCITLPFIVFILKPALPRRVRIFLKILFVIVLVAGLVAVLPKDNPLMLLELLIAFTFLFFLQRNWQILLSKMKSKVPVLQKAKQIKWTKLREGFIHFDRISPAYRRIVVRMLATSGNRRKTIAMVILFSLFAFLLVPLGLVQSEFFPKSDEDFIYMNLELPAGTVVATTKKEAIGILDRLKSVPYLQFATVDVGQALDTTGGGFAQGGGNQALFTLVLTKHGTRPLSSGDIAQKTRDLFPNYAPGKLSVEEISGGPPAGADLQIKFTGDDLIKLNSYAKTLEAFLKTQPGVANTDISIKPGTSKLVFTPDKKKMATANLSPDVLGLWLRTYASGFAIDSMTLPDSNNKKEDITLRFTDQTERVESASSLTIPTANGQLVPLSSLGTLTLASNPTQITREDNKRTLSVTASVAKGFNIADINKRLEAYANTLSLPTGYSWKTGGVNDENQKSVNSILQAMLLSFLLIIITMVIQFSSFRRALIVMLVIPLSISGVFIIFALSHTPLSFPALIGILALFGIVVKNSILIVDKIVANQKIGMDLTNAIADASQSRLEAIALTSVCTIAGLVPITLSDPIWRGLGGAIIAGLTFSGTIMLFFIPVVYYMWFQSEEKKARAKRIR